eukprot:TRINITY_DN7552_c0_g1_i1.p1 TRINITY_DN7552_c0_g1~~TRINITY_DN7552_c0_g1_i1.p1  ORF type:complete len:371 (-),score=40.26 TRINITY_DN7552_c0_g1_i1:177-1289(-)
MLPVQGEHFDDYVLQSIIGEGSMGQAYRAIDVSGHSEDARQLVEVVVKIYAHDKAANQFENEVAMMKRVSGHPNVVEFLASRSAPITGIVMPFYGDVNLHRYVWQCDGLPEFQAAGITRDLLCALQHVHSCGILHRDVKPENMVLDQTGRTVLLDFDVACDTSDRVALAIRCGSIGYVAPEVIQCMPCSFSSDIFSVGCVVYYMVAKVHPFIKKKGETPDDIMKNGIACKLSFGKRFKNVSMEYLNFIGSIVLRTPQQRLSGPEASVHPWLMEEDAAESREIEPEVKVPETHGATTMLFEPPPEAHRAGNKSATSSRLSRARTVGRSIVSKLTRAVRNSRRGAPRVSPLSSIYEVREDNVSCMSPVLLRA